MSISELILLQEIKRQIALIKFKHQFRGVSYILKPIYTIVSKYTFPRPFFKKETGQ